MSMSELRFCANHQLVKESDQLVNYTVPSYPPPDDFYVSVDENGKPLSKYSDGYWNFNAYGCYGFNFSRLRLSKENNKRLKELVFVHIYYMPLFPGKIISLKSRFFVASTLCKIADDNGITVDRFWLFPRLANDIIQVFKPHTQRILFPMLSAVLREEKVLGWKIADDYLIKRLAKLQIPYIPTQSAYIPPRIWMSLVQQTERFLMHLK